MHASGSVGVGYQFMPYMAVETGYTDFGRVKFRNANPFDRCQSAGN